MRIACVLALALTAPACGDDDCCDSTPLTVDGLQDAYRGAACTYLVNCGQYPDRATCLSANLPTLTDSFTFHLDPELIAAVHAGRVQLDSARVSACLALIAATSCEGLDRPPLALTHACAHYLHGTRAAGETCFLGEECISQQCSGGITSDACIAGSCVGDTPPSFAPAELGMPCTFDPGCVDGAFCDYNDTSTCVAVYAEGAACTSYDQCATGLTCLGDTGLRTCTRPPRVGEPCPDGACAGVGAICASGICKQRGLPPAACTSSFDCAPGYPCDPTSGTCVRGPGAGEPCAMSTLPYCFDYGVVCDSVSSTCITPRADGQQCTVDALCKSEHCDLATGTCAPPPMCF